MAKILQETNIKRQSGFLYFCGTNGKTGCLTICEAKMSRGGKKKKAIKKKVIKRVTKK